MTKAAETVIGFRRGSRCEMWIAAITWDLIDQKNKTKLKRDHAKTLTNASTLDENYRATNRTVKRSCKVNKKNWLESKFQKVNKLHLEMTPEHYLEL